MSLLHPARALAALSFGLSVVASAPASARTATLELDGAPTRFVVSVVGADGKPEAVAASQVTEIAAVGVLGSPIEVARADGPDGRVRATLTERPGIVTLSIDRGVWSRGADGKPVARPMNEVPGAKEATHERLYAKTVVRWSAGAVRPVGYPLEIMPLAVQPLKPGQPLGVRVLFEGRPLAGVPVSAGEASAPATTDANGVAMINARPGRNVVQVVHRVPVEGDAAMTHREFRFALLFMVE